MIRPASTSAAETRQTAARLTDLIDRFKHRRIAIVGDVIADEFIYGQIARVSREAPVLILKYDSTEIVPGGAGNAANNAAALGGKVRLVGLIGRDEPGERLLASFHAQVETGDLVRPSTYRTPTKTRILAGGTHSAKQQVVRVDRDAGRVVAKRVREAFDRRVDAAVSDCDAIVFSDYGSGLISPALVDRVKARLTRPGRPHSVPILVDSRYDLAHYRGVTACTPNEPEVEHMLGVRIDDDLGVLERAGRAVLKQIRAQAVLITRGSRGIALFEPRRSTVHIPIFGSDEIADVTGAGDTVISAMALALASGASFCDAARLANYAGGIVVMKRGTATVSADELRSAVNNS